MFPIINIGPLAIQASGLIILIGIWVAISINEKYAVNTEISANDLSNAILIGMVSVVLGARLAFVLQYFSTFRSNPLSIFSLNLAMFDFTSGIPIGILAILIFIQRKKISFWKFMDALTPGIAVFAPFFFISRLASGKLYGSASDLPWAIELWGTTRHPLQIYYLILSLLILWGIFALEQPSLPDGVLFLFWFSLSNISIIFLETFHGEPVKIIGNFILVQLIAWVFLFISLIQLKNLILNEGVNE